MPEKTRQVVEDQIMNKLPWINKEQKKGSFVDSWEKSLRDEETVLRIKIGNNINHNSIEHT